MRALAICLTLWAGAGAAQESPLKAAQAAAQALEVAQVLLDTADTKRDRVAALTGTVQAYEAGLVAMRDGLRRATIRQRTIEAELQAKRAEVGQLLGVLQAIGRSPTPLLLLHPNGPLGTARGGMIAADVTPALQARVEALRARLQEVDDLRALQGSAVDTLTQGLQGAQTARTQLSAAISDRTDLPRRFADDPVQTALLLASTETLDGFASALTDTFLADGSSGASVTADGDLALPVQGRILRGYNAPDAAGIARPGLIIAARPRAIVTTPTAATVLFRGPLLDYGNVVILEPAADTLFVIAGLAEVYGEAGEVLPQGSPIGLMGGENTRVDAILTDSDTSGPAAATETLYLEVRDGQSPVNPAVWFALE